MQRDIIGGFRYCQSAFWEPSSIKCCDSRWLHCSRSCWLSLVSYPYPTPGQPASSPLCWSNMVGFSRGVMAPDLRVAFCITNSSEGGRYRRGDQTHCPAAFVTIWVDFLILSDSQQGSCLSPFIIWGGGGGASSSPDSDRLPSNQSRDCSATVGAASISPGSHYTETARKRGSETEMKIEEKMRGKGKIEKKRSRTEQCGGGTEGNDGDCTP